MPSLKNKRKTNKYKGAKRRLKLTFFIICLVILITPVILFFQSLLAAANPGASAKIQVAIPQGANSYKIASILKNNGLIKNQQAFIYYSRLTGQDNQLKSGNYSLSPSYDVPQMIDFLVEGAKDTLVFTVPEGYTLEQIANLLEDKGLADRERFEQLVSDGDFNFPFIDGLEHLPEGSSRLEGYLFPDTYHVGSTITEKELINIMLKRFDKEMQQLQFIDKASEKGLSLNEAVTIASMIEGEARVDEERPVIAGVIFNRLELGMPLQLDATVQYALQGHRSKIYYEDLEVDSPYNTYQVPGLPPGPIGAPGRKSLQAVLEPEKNDYLYYVAKPDGTHAFARTLQGHNANISKYQ